MKCPAQVVVAHGMTHRAPHHVAQAGMTVQVALAQVLGEALVHLAQAGIVAQALAQVIQVLHQAGINYVFC